MADDADKEGGIEAHLLERVLRLSLRQVQVLKSYLLTTIEALVGIAATEEGRTGLREALDIAPEASDDLLQEARDKLGEERFLELVKPKPGGPTGILWDERP